MKDLYLVLNTKLNLWQIRISHEILQISGFQMNFTWNLPDFIEICNAIHNEICSKIHNEICSEIHSEISYEIHTEIYSDIHARFLAHNVSIIRELCAMPSVGMPTGITNSIRLPIIHHTPFDFRISGRFHMKSLKKYLIQRGSL